jgi:hypothetical protein
MVIAIKSYYLGVFTLLLFQRLQIIREFTHTKTAKANFAVTVRAVGTMVNTPAADL